jgi:hypothetical protein
VQLCKQAFLKLHQIQESRLRRKVYENREQNEDMRGHHQYRYSTIPLEVGNDIREFIENYPSRESLLRIC